MVEWTAYVDEAGKDEKSNEFVLACIIGSPATIAKLSCAVREFKRGLAPEDDPDSWELHGKDMMRGSKPRQKRGLRVRTTMQRIAIFNAALTIVREHDVTLFCVLVSNKKGSKAHNRDKILEYAVTILFERLDQFVHTSETADTVRIVSDYVTESHQKKIAAAFTNSKQGNSTISNIQTSHVTGIEYVDSKNSVPIQIADLIAYVVKRYRNGDKNFEKAFLEMVQSMETSVRGEERTFTIIWRSRNGGAALQPLPPPLG